MNSINDYSSDCDDDLPCSKKTKLNNNKKIVKIEECDAVTNTATDTDKNSINNADAILTVTNTKITSTPCYVEDDCKRYIEFDSKNNMYLLTYFVNNVGTTNSKYKWGNIDDYIHVVWAEYSIKMPLPNIFSTNELKHAKCHCYHAKTDTDTKIDVKIILKIQIERTIKLLDTSNIKPVKWRDIESDKSISDYNIPHDQRGKTICLTIASLIKGFDTTCLFKYIDDKTFIPVFPIDDVIYIKNTNLLACTATHGSDNKITFRERPVMHSFAGGFGLKCKFSYFPRLDYTKMLKIKIVHDNLLFFLVCDEKTYIASVKLHQRIINTKLIINGMYDKIHHAAVVNFVAN